MAILTIPAPPPTVPDLEATADSDALVTDVGKAREGVAAASAWAEEGGAPTDWEGDAAEVADHARSAQMADLDVAAAVLHRAETALSTFVQQMTGLRTRRADLVDTRSDLSGRQADLAARAASYTEDEEAGLRTEAQTLQADIDAFVGDVETWQTDVTTAEDTLVAALQTVDTTAEGQQLIEQIEGEMDALLAGLVSRGVLPEGADDWSPEKLRSYLIEHPEAAEALLQNQPIPGTPGAAGLLAALTGPAFIDPSQSDADAERRNEGLRALFESLPPEEAQLLAMLYPGVVGNASGVPFEYRADANTVAVVVALEHEEANLQDLEDQHEHHQSDWDLFGLNNDDLVEPIADSQSRIDLYRSILEDDRQILYFDPSGDGAIAELHGSIDSTTSNVGVQVPGTTTDMASFQGVADTAQGFVDHSDGLAMVSWMGGDLPDDIVWNAPDPSYAQDLGPVLAGFSHDVRQEIDHSPGAGNDVQTTYLGHSYGGAVVGLAETHGLDADRVLHVESAGMGAGVDGPGDLPSSQDDVDRYSMTAPGDPIGITQGQGAFGLGHGADPDTFAGTERLDTGYRADGTTLNIDTDAHSLVFEEQSDAWRNMLEVLNGGTAVGYREPEYEVYPTYGPGPAIIEQTGWETPGAPVEVE